MATEQELRIREVEALEDIAASLSRIDDNLMHIATAGIDVKAITTSWYDNTLLSMNNGKKFQRK